MQPRLLETVRHSFATGEPYSMKYRMRHADGAYRWVDGRGEPVRDQSGAIVQWYAISIDIDDEMRAQEALRDRERQLQQLIDIVPVQIWCVTPGGDPAYINKTMMDYIGLTLDDFDAEGGLSSAIQTDRPSGRQGSFTAGPNPFLQHRRAVRAEVSQPPMGWFIPLDGGPRRTAA